MVGFLVQGEFFKAFLPFFGASVPHPLLCANCVELIIYKKMCRSLQNKIEGSNEALRRAASLPILLCHGSGEYYFSYLSIEYVLMHVNYSTLNKLHSYSCQDTV